MDKKVETLKAHPAAEAYRMMDDDELAELAASIKANGLRDPITVGIIGKQRWLIDGRNRERACEAAGVQPDYEEIEFGDEASLRAFIADRGERRNVSKAQKAMAWALLFPDAEKGGRGKKTMNNLHSFWPTQLADARAVLGYSRELAEQVRDGYPLSKALKEAQDGREAVRVERESRARLRESAPQLLASVEEGRMTLDEAVATLDMREENAKKEKKAAEEKAKADELERRLGYLRLASDTLTGLIAWTDKTMVDLSELMQDAEFAVQMRNMLGGRVADFRGRLPEGSRMFIEFIEKEFGK